MKRWLWRFALPIFVILPLPFFYNACHNNNLVGGTTFSSSSASCKVAMEKGEVTKLEFKDSEPPVIFASSKIRLRDSTDTSAIGQQKALAPLTLPEGTRLGVIMDNGCLQANASSLDAQVISKAVTASGQLLPALDRQAYEWVLDQDSTDADIEAKAAREPCVVGISWNKSYSMQSTSFNDPDVSQQSHLTADNAFAAYDYFYNSAGGMLQTTSNPVLVAVVDTGVDWNHPEILPNIWTHSLGVGIDITTLGTSQVNYNPTDVSGIGHGTHVAGMIAAAANNQVGIVGVMPFDAKIMAIRLFQSDSQGNLSTTSQYLYNALKFAYLNGASVVNLSLGNITTGAATDSVVEAGIDEAVAHGTTIVTVIGNADSGNGALVDGVNLSSIPGQFSYKAGVIGVGAYDTTTGAKSYFSHYSTVFAEIGAPGAESSTTGLYSTIPMALGSYGRLSGTSQAAPQVTAAAGLAIGLIRHAYNVSPSPAEVERLILTSAAKSAQLTPYFKAGNKLDLYRLVGQINNDYPRTRTSGLGAISLSSMGCSR